MSNQNKQILVVGSIAYDQILRYKGIFQEKLIPSAIDVLSISLTVTDRKMCFGGCAGNISFHLKKNNAAPVLTGIAGKDFEAYEKWLEKHKIDTSCLIRNENKYTSSAWIATDLKGHQITIFDNGAAEDFSETQKKEFENNLKYLKKNIVFAIISPANQDLIRYAVWYCKQNKIPYFFDPSQIIHEFPSDELRKLVKDSFGIFMNEYEKTLLLKQTEWSQEILEKNCSFIIETLAEKGSLITYKGKKIFIDPVPVKRIVDPTGCGDAYRAGFLKVLAQNLNFTIEDLKTAGSFGSLLASKVLAIQGTQG